MQPLFKVLGLLNFYTYAVRTEEDALGGSERSGFVAQGFQLRSYLILRSSSKV